MSASAGVEVGGAACTVTAAGGTGVMVNGVGIAEAGAAVDAAGGDVTVGAGFVGVGVLVGGMRVRVGVLVGGMRVRVLVGLLVFVGWRVSVGLGVYVGVGLGVSVGLRVRLGVLEGVTGPIGSTEVGWTPASISKVLSESDLSTRAAFTGWVAAGVPNTSKPRVSAQGRQRTLHSHPLAGAFELVSQDLFIIPPWLMDNGRPAVSVFARADKSPAPSTSVAA